MEDGLWKEIDEKKFFFSKDEVNAKDAYRICDHNGLRLYEPRDNETYRKVEEIVMDLDARPLVGFWIGVNDEAIEGR